LSAMFMGSQTKVEGNHSPEVQRWAVEIMPTVA
jgi:hypothetical protein